MAKEKTKQVEYKEAYDRCLCMLRIFKDVVLTHPAIEQSEQATHLAQGAYAEMDAIAKLLLMKAKNNDGTIHDRAYCIFIIVNELLVNHPTIIKDKQAKAYAKIVSDTLWALYQYKSDKFFIDKPEPKGKSASKKVRAPK